MSDTLRPWLAEAVSQYRLSHGRNLTFTKKGRLLQVVQYNNYRNTSLQEEKRKDVYAWAHDKAYEVLIRFDSQVVNAFEETHESFTSYRYGLFHILEYKFVLGTDYISEEPRSNIPTRTIEDLANPRMFYLLVTKFNYISSKGEGNFGPRTRKFEELTRNWKTDIEVDEEKKRGLVIQNTASQTHAHDAPPSLEEMQAAADVIRAKRNSSGRSSGRSPKRQRISRSLNLNNMPVIPPELLATMGSPPVQGSDLAEREQSQVQSNLVETELPPVQTDETEDLLEILPSTPAPPSSSDSGNTTVNNTVTTTTTIRLERELVTTREASPSLIQNVLAESSKLQGAAMSTVTMGTQPVSDRDLSADTMAAPISSPPTGPSNRALGNRSPPAKQDRGSQEPPLDAVLQVELREERQLSTSAPARKKRKSEPLPRFPLESRDSSMEEPIAILENESYSSARQSTPKNSSHKETIQTLASSTSPHQHRIQAGSNTSILVDVASLGDANSSPQAPNGDSSNHKPDLTALETNAFYGHSKPLFRAASSPLKDTTVDVTVTAQSVVDPGNLKSDHLGGRPSFFIGQDGESVSSAASSSGLSSDGFEFVSFINGTQNDVFLPSVKIEEDAMRMHHTVHLPSPQMPDLPFSPPLPLGGKSVSIEPSPTLEAPPLALQLNTVSQEDLNELLKQVRYLFGRKRSTTSFDSRRGNISDRENARSSSSATPVPPGRREDMASSLRDFMAQTKIGSILARPQGISKDSAQAPPANVRAVMTLDSKPNGVESLSHSSFSALLSTRATNNAPKSAQAVPIPSHRHPSAPGTLSLNANEPPRPLSRSISASRRTSGPSIQQSDARKAVNLIMEDIKTMLESKGLTRRQSIDLWYCCSGDLDAACQIAESNLDIVRSIQDEVSSDGPTHDGRIALPNTRNVYKRCWTLEDDQAVEDPNPEQFKIARKLQQIESRRGKGSVASRRRFLTENPLARKLARKVRYPYDEDDS